MIQVTPSQLFTLLVSAIKARLNVLVVGGPGVGKSDITAQAAAACDADHLISHPAVEDPTVPAGMPWVNAKDEFASFKPFGNLYRAMKATKLTVWNLEDLGQAAAMVQAGYMQLLLAKEVNGHKLPGCVTFVATTNRRTDRAGVSGILEPVKSRFATIVELIPVLDEWAEWYVRQSFFIPELLAFLRFREKDSMLYNFNPSADLVNSPLPRTWANASKILQLNLPKAIEAQAVGGAVGEGPASEFLGFREMYHQLPSIDGILQDPKHAPMPDNLSALFAVTTGLAAKAELKNFAKVIAYIERLMDIGRQDFAGLCVRDATRRLPALQQTPEFVRVATGPLGQLVVGGVR